MLVTGGYFQEHHDAVFYPTIAVQFRLSGDREHYHIAVLDQHVLVHHVSGQLSWHRALVACDEVVEAPIQHRETV